MAKKASKGVSFGAPAVPVTRLAWVIVKAAITLGLMLGLVASLIWLGSQAGHKVANQNRYTIPFAAIVVDAPPGRTTEQFLNEVRALSNLPDQLQSVDANLPQTLSTAFARHPLVASVLSVSVEPNGTVKVSAKYRQPTLVIMVKGQGYRVLDRTGVLMPLGTDPGTAAGLTSEVNQEAIEPGQVWPDTTVKRAAELAAAYSPRAIQRTLGGWRLGMPDGKVLLISW